MTSRHRIALSALVLSVAAAEWLRHPTVPLVAIAAVLTALAILALFRGVDRPRSVAPVAVWLVVVPLALGWFQYRVHRVETDWPAVRESILRHAAARLSSDLREALSLADRLAQVAAAAGAGERAQAFDQLRQAVPVAGPAAGTSILETTGTPWAWAGRQQEYPVLSDDSLLVTGSHYDLILETQRSMREGRTAIGTVLLWADPIVRGFNRSLANRFELATGVRLHFSTQQPGPVCSDPFDYEQPTTGGARRLFTVCPEPPDQGAAMQSALRQARATVGWLVVAGLLLGLIAAGSPFARVAVLLGALWLGIRAPVADAMGLGLIFSPATFFQTVLGPLSSSAGALLLTGVAATVVGIGLWRRRLPRNLFTIALAAVLLIGAPYLISELGRGITPPSTGVTTRLWLIWQLALVMGSSAMIVLAAALLRGANSREVPRWITGLGVVIAIGAAAVGTVTWSPRPGWPIWYPFLWTPALILVTLPTRRRVAIAGIALVAGSAAALVTWGAELRARLQVAERDVSQLGGNADALAAPLLMNFADAAVIARPTDPTSLYALYRRSGLGDAAYPVRLALWSPAGDLKAELGLDALDLPAPIVSGLVRDFNPGSAPKVLRLLRVPGLHYVLLQRLDSATVLTAAIGPRTRLIGPTRLGALLRTPTESAALYELSLSPPTPGVPADSLQLRWRRDGWSVRSERRISLPGGARHVYAVVDMRDPFALSVRGALVVLLDVLALGLVWLMAEWGSVGAPSLANWRRLGRSFQFRTAFALALFFLIPAVGFSIWGMSRLGAEYRRAGDLLVLQSLRDAMGPAARLMEAPASEIEGSLKDLSERLDATLALYSGGRMLAVSDPVLADLGFIRPLVDPDPFTALALHDGIEVTRGTPANAPTLVAGYRVVLAGPPGGIGLLATLKRPAEVHLRESQRDIALVLLLGTLLGLGAAIVGAQVASRALARPVEELGRIASAIGHGERLPLSTSLPPLEFEPVFGAIERMSADVRTSELQLDEARRRTAAVLAHVATGVVALDADGKVLMANPRAAELLGESPMVGQRFRVAEGSGWQPLIDAARKFSESERTESGRVELEIGGRRATCQLSSLGPSTGGVVLAFDDVTDVARAERVLAWGEVARQVAHEVKNPLTPIRLGVQHLRRIYRQDDPGFAATLAETSDRILGEIDRLDTIARAFSRFAAPAPDVLPLERLELGQAIRETVSLYTMGGGAEVVVVGGRASWVAARRDEVKEVIVNLIENAREAGAQAVRIEVGDRTVTVRDDGRGIAEALLPRIFEPRFSTTTSGAGLGLAIVQRLVQSWQARVEVTSVVGEGTTIRIIW
ncbi:MAG: ATP-binding protein [Gemmatimonadota bacterium]